MILPVIAAFASSLACSGPDAGPPCMPVTEISTRTRLTIRKRPSCAGLTAVEKLYSVGIENGIICLPLSSLVAPATVPR